MSYRYRGSQLKSFAASRSGLFRTPQKGTFSEGVLTSARYDCQSRDMD